MNFQIGQIFSPDYPPEAADWCNGRGDCFIEEIPLGEDGQRRFRISEVQGPSLVEAQTEMLNQVKEKFLAWYEHDAVATSSLGFRINSNIRAKNDVEGLIKKIESLPESERSGIYFRDYDNKLHEVTLEQVKTMDLEIIDNGLYAYDQKWAYENQINNAESVSELQSIVIEFKGRDFSNDAS